MSAKKIISVRPNGTKRVQTVNDLPSRTQKQYKDQVNINKIMQKYKATGTITHIRNAAQGVYMDLTQIGDYAESLMQIQRANEAFEQIPAELRIKFQNDPSKLISYLADSKNHEEAVKLGLMVKRETQNEPNETQNAQSPKA